MQTRIALEQYAGRTVRGWGEQGPFGRIAATLLEKFQQQETDRVAAAEARATLADGGPMVAAYERVLRESREASLMQSALPMISTFDAYVTVKAASREVPQDRGLKLCAAHLMRLWRSNPEGALAVGDVARLREHYGRAHPKSTVVAVLDRELPKVGFNTLPVRDLAHAAGYVHDQESYERACHALSIAGNRPEQMRARAYLRGLLAVQVGDPAVDAGNEQSGRGGEAAFERTVARLLTDSDPLLSCIAGPFTGPGGGRPSDGLGEAEDGGGAGGRPGGPGGGPAGGPEPGMPLHDERAETYGEVKSPNTGEPMVLELAPAEASDFGENGGPEPEVRDITPEEVESFGHYGQLADFDGVDTIPAVESAEVVNVADPTAPGATVEVTLRPGEAPGAPPGGLPSGGSAGASSAPMLTSAAATTPAAAVPLHTWAVYVVRNGIRANEPVDAIRARTMPHALAELGRRLARVDQNAPLRSEVRAPPNEFAVRALVVDPASGDSLFITAADGLDFEPKINEQQPNDAVKVPEDGAAALAADHFSPSSGSGYKAAAATAVDIERAVFDEGRRFAAGTWSMRVAEDGQLEIVQNGQHRTAALTSFDEEAAGFIEHATKIARGEVPGLEYSVRPFMVAACMRCGSINPYVQPDAPLPLGCACGYVTSPEDVARQLFARRDASPPGYLLTTDLPGDAGPDQARRVLLALREVVPTATGEHQGTRLAVELPPIGPSELARIHRVLADRFGVRAETAPGQPATPGTPGTLPQSVLPPPGSAPGTASAPAPGPGGAPGTPGAPIGAPVSAPAPAVAPAAVVGQPPRRGGAPRSAGERGARRFLVAYLDPAGVERTVPVEATDPAAARDVFARTIVGTVQHIRQALSPDGLDGIAFPPGSGEPEALGVPADMGSGAGETWTPPGAPGGGAFSGIPDEVKQAIAAAMVTFRNSGADIASGIRDFQNQFRKFLEQFGEEGSPQRQAIGAEIVRAAQEAWSRPAILVRARGELLNDPKPAPRGEAFGSGVEVPAGTHFWLVSDSPDLSVLHEGELARSITGNFVRQTADGRALIRLPQPSSAVMPPSGKPPAGRIAVLVPFGRARKMRAGRAGGAARSAARTAAGMDPEKVNTQQKPAVTIPKRVLGPDSSTGHPGPKAPKPKAQQPLSRGTSTADPSWSGHQESSSQSFPKTPKPVPKGTDDSDREGTSFADPDFGDSPPYEHGTGDNPTTEKWDSVSRKARPGTRSGKQVGKQAGRVSPEEVMQRIEAGELPSLIVELAYDAAHGDEDAIYRLRSLDPAVADWTEEDAAVLDALGG